MDYNKVAQVNYEKANLQNFFRIWENYVRPTPVSQYRTGGEQRSF